MIKKCHYFYSDLLSAVRIIIGLVWSAKKIGAVRRVKYRKICEQKLELIQKTKIRFWAFVYTEDIMIRFEAAEVVLILLLSDKLSKVITAGRIEYCFDSDSADIDDYHPLPSVGVQTMMLIKIPAVFECFHTLA